MDKYQVKVKQKHQIIRVYVLDHFIYMKFESWVYSVYIYRYTYLWIHHKTFLEIMKTKLKIVVISRK